MRRSYWCSSWACWLHHSSRAAAFRSCLAAVLYRSKSVLQLCAVKLADGQPGPSSLVCSNTAMTRWQKYQLAFHLPYPGNPSRVFSCLQVIKSGMGSLPFFKDEEEQAAEDAKAEGKSIEQVQAPSAMPVSNRPAVLADGSYATQSALSDTFALPSLSTTQLNLRWSSLHNPPPPPLPFPKHIHTHTPYKRTRLAH